MAATHLELKLSDGSTPIFSRTQTVELKTSAQGSVQPVQAQFVKAGQFIKHNRQWFQVIGVPTS